MISEVFKEGVGGGAGMRKSQKVRKINCFRGSKKEKPIEKF